MLSQNQPTNQNPDLSIEWMSHEMLETNTLHTWVISLVLFFCLFIFSVARSFEVNSLTNCLILSSINVIVNHII